LPDDSALHLKGKIRGINISGDKPGEEKLYTLVEAQTPEDIERFTKRKKPELWRISPLMELPPQLRVTLGKTLHVGDLEVTPQKVEQKHLVFNYRSGLRSDRADQKSLVLHLLIKNVSKDAAVRPIDSSFDRAWHKTSTDANAVNPDRPDEPPFASTMPYTYLAVRGNNYFGPCPWLPGSAVKPGDTLRDEYVEGQEEDGKTLQPGEELRTVFATNPGDEVPEQLRNYKGKMIWRVHLRRGFVRSDGKDVSATAVIGVEFDMSQVEKE
jgi:hypothetical protein